MATHIGLNDNQPKYKMCARREDSFWFYSLNQVLMVIAGAENKKKPGDMNWQS